MRKIVLFVFPFIVFANENTILSNSQKDIIDLKEKIIKENKKIDKKSWLSNINLNGSINYNKNNDKTSSLKASYNQDIFNFGGITYSIDLAKIQEQYDLLNLDMTYDNYIKNIYTDVLNIYILNIQIKKQKLNIENKQINIQIKKTSYSEGQIDINDLNDAIISKNTQEEKLIELLNNKEEAISNLKKYSSLNYKRITIPKLKIINLNKYLKTSKDIKLAEKNIKLKSLNQKITKTKYLPKLTLTTNGTYENIEYSNTENSYYNYGLQISMPINFSSSNIKEKARLNQLLAKKQKEQILIEKNNSYEKLQNKIKKYNNLNKIAKKDILLYKELLEVVNDEYKAGYKAIEDVKILSNTKKIRELDIKLNGFNIQKQLLEFYF